MYLTDVLKSYRGGANPLITDVTQDSRAVAGGSLFVAIRGAKTDGHDYAAEAARKGAAAIVVEKGSRLFKPHNSVVIEVEDTRAALSEAAAGFYEDQPAHIIAVTGTNGKTSVAHFVRQIWEALGHKAVSLGTLGVHGFGVDKSGALTTPDTVGLHRELSTLALNGVDHLVMEASSHGIEQRRLDSVRLKVAGFTNLTQDHLDYHKNMEDYFKAKARLFTELLPKGGTAVINADSKEGQKLLKLCEKRGLKILSYGFKGSDIKIDKIEPAPHGQDITFTVTGQTHHLELPLVGAFQVMNALCAMGLVLADAPRINVKKIIKALSHLEGAAGRLEPVEGHPRGAVYVDYAHTPDALEHVLKALRPHTQGRLFCIVGCGGDRDKGKRPLMGALANDLADVAIITDDNPRTEDAAAIRKQMMKDAPKAREIGDRALAISIAVNEMQEGDVLVIAGKGHEQGQIIGDTVVPFDDATQAQNAIGLLLGNETDDRAKGQC